MAYHHNYMMPMFSVPQVTWANQSIGQASVGRFPNPKSVMRICKYRVCEYSQDSTLIFGSFSQNTVAVRFGSCGLVELSKNPSNAMQDISFLMVPTEIEIDTKIFASPCQ